MGTTKTVRKTAVELKEATIKGFKLPRFNPANTTQKELFSYCLEAPLVLATGPAGTGKSYVGAFAAARLLVEKHVDKIILTRNPLPTGPSLGFFAGSEKEKMAVWLAPVIGTLKKILKTPTGTGDGYFNYLVENGKIEFQPLETIKGSSFDRTFILVEESQELDFEQLKCLTTRIGEGSHLFLNGDFEQGNSRQRGEQAFKQLAEALKEDAEKLSMGYDLDEWEKIFVPVIEFSDDQIVRSPITRKMVNIFKKLSAY